MNFRPEMVEAIRRGKCETRRVANDNPNSPWFRGGCGYRMWRLDDPGEKNYAICPGRGKKSLGRLELITEPSLTTVGAITDLGGRREGFADRDEFLAYFKKLNPRVGLATEVWAVHFSVVRWNEDDYLRWQLAEAKKKAAAA